MVRVCQFLKGTLLISVVFCPAAFAQTIEASVTSALIAGDQRSSHPSVSSDSEDIVFSSLATNLVDGDTNGVADIFLHHQEEVLPGKTTGGGARATSRISLALGGGEPNGASHSPVISASGRYVAFVSAASNLVESDVNGKEDVFFYDRNSGVTRLVSQAYDNSGAPAAAADGDSGEPAISSDGCLISFSSHATNLRAVGTSGDPISDTNGKRDIFLFLNPNGTDCAVTTAQLEFLSVGANDELGNGDSYAPATPGTRLNAFVSEATNLVADDTNGVSDIFVRDRAFIEDSRATLMISRATNETPGNGASYSVAADGLGFAFDSDATNLIVSDANGKRDVFKRTIGSNDRTLGATELVSVTLQGVQGDGDSRSPVVAEGMNYIAFASDATNLADRTDCNAARDIFVRDYVLGTLRRINLSSAAYQTAKDLASDRPAISGGAFLVAYESAATFFSADTNSVVDIFGSIGSEDPNSRDNPLTASERLDEPPEICVSRRSAGIFMERYSGIDTTQSSAFGIITPRRSQRCPTSGLCYSVTIKPRGRAGERVTKIVKRNQLTVRGLRPGKYTANFRVSGKSGGTTIATNKSPTKRFSVSGSG